MPLFSTYFCIKYFLKYNFPLFDVWGNKKFMVSRNIYIKSFLFYYENVFGAIIFCQQKHVWWNKRFILCFIHILDPLHSSAFPLLPIYHELPLPNASLLLCFCCHLPPLTPLHRYYTLWCKLYRYIEAELVLFDLMA
mgnify:CR=1 FL=1